MIVRKYLIGLNNIFKFPASDRGEREGGNMNREILFSCCNIPKFLEEKLKYIKEMTKEDMTQENLAGFEYAEKNIISLVEQLVNYAESDGEILVHSSKLNTEYEIEEFDLHDLLAHFNCRVIVEEE